MAIKLWKNFHTIQTWYNYRNVPCAQALPIVNQQRDTTIGLILHRPQGNRSKRHITSTGGLLRLKNILNRKWLMNCRKNWWLITTKPGITTSF